jgi:hypothetical protein
MEMFLQFEQWGAFVNSLLLLTSPLPDACRGRASATPQRDWLNHYKQLETLVMLDWVGLRE